MPKESKQKNQTKNNQTKPNKTEIKALDFIQGLFNIKISTSLTHLENKKSHQTS